MTPQSFSRFVLNERPTTTIQPNTFRRETVQFKDVQPGEKEVLIQTTYISLDPAMRGWLRDVRSYVPPVKIGEIMRATGLGVVVQAGKNSEFAVGDHVSGLVGWTEYAVLPDKRVTKLDIAPGAQPLDYLNNLGVPGMTAYFGLKDVGKLKAGETLLVSGAAGAVGSLACQLGKKTGATVFAIAGSDEKCQWLEKELGVDKAFNYKSSTFAKDLKQVGYIDVFFDNVGGPTLDLVLTRLNKGARIALCGAISQYNAVRPDGIHNYLTLISQRARIEGFIVFDYESQYPEAIKEIASWLGDGSIKRKFHVVKGLDNAAAALDLLYTGGNTGKLVVKVSDEPRAKL